MILCSISFVYLQFIKAKITSKVHPPQMPSSTAVQEPNSENCSELNKITDINPDEKSVTDYAITSNDLAPFLKSTVIDESKKLLHGGN